VADTADRDANRALRTRFDDVFGQYQRLRSGLDELQDQLAEMQVSAESEDGLIKATVDPRGQLVDLRLDRRVYREMDPEQLSRAIVATAGKAVTRTTEQVTELMAEYLPADSGAMRFVRDNNFSSLLRRQDQLMHPSSGHRDV